MIYGHCWRDCCKYNTFLYFDLYTYTYDEGPMLETLDYTICIGSTPTFLYFDLYLYSAYAASYIYIYPFNNNNNSCYFL